MVASSISTVFSKLLNVVKAAPQARPKTTWRACIAHGQIDLIAVTLMPSWWMSAGSIVTSSSDRSLRRAWDDAWTFKRASRSLAKTGLCWGLFWCLFLVCFLGCFFGAQRVPKGSPKGSKIDEKYVSKRSLKKGPKQVPKMMIFRTPQSGSNNTKIDDFRILVLGPFGVSFWGCFGCPNGGQKHEKVVPKKSFKTSFKNNWFLIDFGVPFGV